MPVYQTCPPNLSDMPVYQTCLPTLSDMLVYQACLAGHLLGKLSLWLVPRQRVRHHNA